MITRTLRLEFTIQHDADSTDRNLSELNTHLHQDTYSDGAYGFTRELLMHAVKLLYLESLNPNTGRGLESVGVFWAGEHVDGKASLPMVAAG